MILPSIILHSPGPVLLNIGPLNLRWYGLLTALAFLVALTVAIQLLKFRKKKLHNNPELLQIQNITEDELTNFCIVILIAGIIGARLWYVFLQWTYYSANPGEIIQIWHGGQSIQGGMVGSIIGAIIFSKDYRELFFKLSLVSSVAPLAQAIGRWGNFFNEEAFGIATNINLPIKLYIHKTGLFHHPTFLYEAIWNLLNFCILMFINKILYERNSKLTLLKKDLVIISSFLVIYSIGRLVIESIRIDSLHLGHFTAASLVSIVMIVCGLGVIFYTLFAKKY